MYDLLSRTGINELKGVLKFLEEKTHKIRNVLPAVFFEKAVLKIFGKLLQNHQRQNAY